MQAEEAAAQNIALCAKFNKGRLFRYYAGYFLVERRQLPISLLLTNITKRGCKPAMLKVLLIIITLSGLWLPTAFASSVTALFDEETSAQIAALLASRSAAVVPVIGVTHLLSHDQLAELYEKRDFQPVWMHGWQLKNDAQVLMNQLRGAGLHGLCGNDYLLMELEGLFAIHEDFSRHNLPLAPENRAVLDLFLSQAFLTFATHMVEGQVDPALTHVDWRARRRKADLVKLLDYATANGRMEQVLDGLLPPHAEYRQLVTALSQYQVLSALGGWPRIPSGPAIRPGYRDGRLPQLKELLVKTGDLVTPASDSDHYDPETVAAVRVFQTRHGLVDDGVIGAKTLAALNVSVEERIRQIELNLERWRWMPKDFGKRHIRVNVADFKLQVVDEGAPVLEMPVIVGTQYRKTPVFSARMTYLEFAPYWTVPPTILREDKLPLIKRNPDYLAEKHFRIVARGDEEVFIDPQTIDWQKIEAEDFPGLLRMDPGPWNPLGTVKFMFPNRFNVYLHDTNEAYLFERNVRSFSSGCIRVERPRELARLLLERELGPAMLEDLFASPEPVQVPIAPLPVHIQYWTAWVDSDGRVNFRPDVYYRDLDLEVALKDPAYRVMDQLQVSHGRRFARLD